MSKLHVLVIPSWYPNGIDKLMGVYHKDFCKALANDGRMIVNMLYIDRQGLSRVFDYIKMKKTFEDKESGYHVYGKRILDFSRINYPLEMENYTNALIKAYKKYEKAVGKPDVIHAQVAIPAGYAACILGKKINVPVIITEHASYFDRFFEGSYKKYNKLVMKRAKITCVGNFMCDTYSKHGVSSSVLPNVIEAANFALEHIKKSDDRFNLVSVCALRSGKCIENAIDAVKNLKEEIPYIRYTVIGDGEDEQRFKLHCTKAQMNDYVSFVGRKSHLEIAQILTKMDSLIIASDFETFGIPAIEALASGLPVVSTKCFGTQSFLDDKCSILCEINDVGDLTRAIKEMHDNYHKFSPEYNKSVAARFDSSKVADLAYECYLDLLRK